MCQTHNTKALNPSSFPSDHIFPFGRLLNRHQLQGRRREVSTGGGADSDWGGTDSGELKLPTPKFLFLLGFRPVYFGNTEKSKDFGIYSEIFL